MSTVKPIPDGFNTLTPYLVVEDGKGAIDLYQRAFGATLVDVAYVPGTDRVMNAQLKVGNSMLMLNDEFPEYGSVGPNKLGGSPVTIHMYCENVDEVFNQAAKEGLEIVYPLEETFWGDRFGLLKDPYGHKWSLATKVKELTPAEYDAKAAEAFSTPPSEA